MDANNTKLHVFMGARDWEPLVAQANAQSPAHSLYWDGWFQGVTLRPRLFAATRGTAPYQLSGRRGNARDRRGDWYWIAENEREIRCIKALAHDSQRFWALGDAVDGSNEEGPEHGRPDFRPLPGDAGRTPRLRGLTITEHDYLVVGVPDPAGLLIFDLVNGGPPAWVRWPLAFSPMDMAPMPGGGVALLEDCRPARVWILDRLFRPDPRYHRPEHAGAERGRFHPRAGGRLRDEEAPIPTIAPEWAIRLEESDVPVAIEALWNGSVLVLEGQDPALGSRILSYYRERLAEICRLQLPADLLTEDGQTEPYPVLAYDWAFQPTVPYGDDRIEGVLYLSSRTEKEAYACMLCSEMDRMSVDLLLRRLPMTDVGGKGLVATRAGCYYEHQERWFYLSADPWPGFDPSATLTTGPLDGKEPQCVWHRVMLDAQIPPGTRIKVESRTADRQADLESAMWQPEPVPYLRPDGAELPYYDPFTAEEKKREETGTWELLLQAATGRYLQVRLTLLGAGQNSPRIRAMRIYYPRFSYLVEYLPAVYREEPDSASFLDRFLANVEGIFTAAEDRIAQVQMLLDARSAPPEFLPWLADWLGIMLEQRWEEERRRLFIRHAHQMFRSRGTVRGLVWAIRLATDSELSEEMFTDPAAIAPYAPPTASWRLVNPYTRPSFFVVETFQERQVGVPTSLDTDPESQDTAEYHRFLERRYHTIADLNAAYETDYKEFGAVALPAREPEGNQERRRDWNDFACYYLPGLRAAHRFTIYVPYYVLANGERRTLNLAVVREIAAKVKPAHAYCEVKRYWAMVQVGVSRLGPDTVVGVGSRLAMLALEQEQDQ